MVDTCLPPTVVLVGVLWGSRDPSQAPKNPKNPNHTLFGTLTGADMQ